MQQQRNIDYCAVLDTNPESEEGAIECHKIGFIEDGRYAVIINREPFANCGGFWDQYDMSCVVDRQTSDVYLPDRYATTATRDRAEKAEQRITFDNEWSYINMDLDLQDMIDIGRVDIVMAIIRRKAKYLKLADEAWQHDNGSHGTWDQHPEVVKRNSRKHLNMEIIHNNFKQTITFHPAVDIFASAWRFPEGLDDEDEMIYGIDGGRYVVIVDPRIYDNSLGNWDDYDMSFLFDRQTGDVYLPKRYPGAETKARAEKAGQIIILDDDWSGLNMDGCCYIDVERDTHRFD